MEARARDGSKKVEKLAMSSLDRLKLLLDITGLMLFSLDLGLDWAGLSGLLPPREARGEPLEAGLGGEGLFAV
jgi:hypothetical protein